MAHPLTQPLTIAHRRLGRRPGQRKTFSKWQDEWLAAIHDSLAASSRAVASRSLWSMRRGLAGQPPTTENLLVWLKRRLAVDKVSAATLQLERSFCNRFFEWCIQVGYIDKNPLAPIAHVPVKVVDKPEITEPEFESLKRASEGTFWPYLMTLAWFTGARSIDLANLRWRNVAFDGQTPRFLEFIPQKTARSGRRVKIPLNEELQKLLTFRRDARGMMTMPSGMEEFICGEAARIHARQDGSFQRQFRGVCDKAGLSRAISFHCFRHTRARRMLSGDNKVTPLVAADVLGIGNLNTLRRYAVSSDSEKENAINL